MRQILLVLVIFSFTSLNAQHYRVDSAVNFTIPDTEGNYYTLFDQFEQGKAVILYFFSITCGTCYHEAPIIDSIYQHYGSGEEKLEVWGIAYPYASNAEIDSFKNVTGVTFPCLTTNMTEPVFYYYGVGYTPQTHIACQYMASGNIGHDLLEDYINGCISTNIPSHKKPKVDIYKKDNTILINNQSNEVVNSSIYDITGRKIESKNIYPKSSESFINMNTRKVYIVHTISESGKIKTKKIIL